VPDRKKLSTIHLLLNDDEWCVYVCDVSGGIIFKHVSDMDNMQLFRYDEVKFFIQRPHHMQNLTGFRNASGESKNTLIAAFKRFVDEYEPIRLHPEKNGWHRRKVKS